MMWGTFRSVLHAAIDWLGECLAFPAAHFQISLGLARTELVPCSMIGSAGKRAGSCYVDRKLGQVATGGTTWLSGFCQRVLLLLTGNDLYWIIGHSAPLDPTLNSLPLV
jgi:hypothetical protein